MLWSGGISFGGVVAFIFADLIIIPILLSYRKYYGTTMTLVILGVFYATMVLAGYAAELLFGAAGLVPATRNATVLDPSVTGNHTTVLDIVLFVFAAALVWRFVRTGGRQMLKMMGGPPTGSHAVTAGRPGHHHWLPASADATRWGYALATVAKELGPAPHPLA